MPWHWPACNSIIKHNDTEPTPRVGERYRCHVCRLGLEFDKAVNTLTVAPLETEHHIPEPPRRTRVIPPFLTDTKALTNRGVERRKAERRTDERRRVRRRKTDRTTTAKRRASKPKHK